MPAHTLVYTNASQIVGHYVHIIVHSPVHIPVHAPYPNLHPTYTLVHTLYSNSHARLYPDLNYTLDCDILRGHSYGTGIGQVLGGWPAQGCPKCWEWHSILGLHPNSHLTSDLITNPKSKTSHTSFHTLNHTLTHISFHSSSHTPIHISVHTSFHTSHPNSHTNSYPSSHPVYTPVHTKAYIHSTNSLQFTSSHLRVLGASGAEGPGRAEIVEPQSDTQRKRDI